MISFKVYLVAELHPDQMSNVNGSSLRETLNVIQFTVAIQCLH